MEKAYKNMEKTLKHLETLHEVFLKEDERYKEFNEKLTKILNDLGFFDELYKEKGRQMILADLIEYIFLGRGYYSVKKQEHKSKFIQAILYFVNMLMEYDSLTVEVELRKKVLDELRKNIPQIAEEGKYERLKNFEGKVGLKSGESDADNDLNKYFDTLLPKTAGGLWHELLAYVFLLRNDVGYIVPLLLSQRLLSLEDHVVPPDFLIITHDKKVYGVEVGTKKEIQSGSFSLKTGIPTVTLDTENSRNSDRCPICNKWIQFCPYVIEKYSDLSRELPEKSEVKCLDECDRYTEDEIVNGKCPYTKYSRNRAETLDHTHHKYADGKHYHYKCVLKKLEKENPDMKKKIIRARDGVALKTHYPYYPGLDELIKERRKIKEITKELEELKQKLSDLENKKERDLLSYLQ